MSNTLGLMSLYIVQEYKIQVYLEIAQFQGQTCMTNDRYLLTCFFFNFKVFIQRKVRVSIIT